MTDRNRATADKEAILVALDQLSQTMDVMAQVINRLKRTVQQAQLNEATSSQLSSQQLDYETAREQNIETLRRNYIRKKAKALQQNEPHELESKPGVVLH